MSKVYFANFPLIDYWFADGIPVRIRHILPRFRMVNLVENNSGNYMDYRIKYGETLEILAQRFYGDARWYWVIALYNNIQDPYEDLPMSTPDLITFTKQEHGALNLNAIHHYEDDLKNECQVAFVPGALPVTNYQYEERRNTARRLVKIPLKKFLPAFQRMLEDALKDA